MHKREPHATFIVVNESNEIYNPPGKIFSVKGPLKRKAILFNNFVETRASNGKFYAK